MIECSKVVCRGMGQFDLDHRALRDIKIAWEYVGKIAVHERMDIVGKWKRRRKRSLAGRDSKDHLFKFSPFAFWCRVEWRDRTAGVCDSPGDNLSDTDRPMTA